MKYNSETEHIYVDKEKYFDNYGKRGATNEELEQYVKYIYYVLLTRGIKGTYIYVCDDRLRGYMSKYIETTN